MVIGFFLGFAASSSDLKLAQVESALIAERASIEAPRPFVPAYLLEQLEQLSPPELEQVISRVSTDTDLIREALQSAHNALSFRQTLRSRGALLESGCRHASGSGFEGSFTESREPRIDLEELATRAYGAVLVKIIEARSGYNGFSFSTRIVAEVLENTGGSPISLEQGNQIEYIQGHYSLKFGEHLLCAERPGFDQPKAGDLILILGAEPTGLQAPDSLVPALMFPVRDGEVVYQPYHFLTRDVPVTLDDLRLELVNGGDMDGYKRLR